VIKPILQALLLADHVYTDDETGKKIITGTYDCIYSTGFPGEFPRATCIYVCLNSIHGQVEIELRFVDWSTYETLMEYGPITINSSDPLASIDFTIPLPSIPLPHSGSYGFELYAGNELLGMVRLRAEQIEEEENDEENSEEMDGED